MQGSLQAGLAFSNAILGANRSDLTLYSKHAMKDPCMATNPRQATKRDIEVVYEESL